MEINLSRIPVEVMETARRISSAGGRALLVGGSVIDLINNRAAKDWDIEVFRLDYTQIEALFPDFPCKDVGRAFGILKLTINGIDIDINVPRTDNKVGKGHSDFVCEVDPAMSVREAARRRDFTINTLALDLETGLVVDESDGLSDLRAGILRVTDSVLFRQDPLRALRAMQLLARKATTVDPNTLRIIKQMHSEFPTLAKERIHEEFRKLLLKAERPSVGLEFLRESGWISWFPELDNLQGCEQRDDWHPEGDVWIHSLLCADAAASIRHLVPEHQREAFVFGAMLHDVGKPSTTITQEMVDAGTAPKELLLTARGHDMAGGPLVETFLDRMTNGKKVHALTRAIVEQHMQPYFLMDGEAKTGAYVRLHNKMRKAGGDLSLIAHQCMCDACATSADWQTRSLSSGSPNWEHTTSQRCLDHFAEIEANEALAEPLVMGRDLIANGVKPGPDMGKLLKKALDIQYGDSKLSKDEILSQVLPGKPWRAVPS